MNDDVFEYKANYEKLYANSLLQGLVKYDHKKTSYKAIESLLIVMLKQQQNSVSALDVSNYAKLSEKAVINALLKFPNFIEIDNRTLSLAGKLLEIYESKPFNKHEYAILVAEESKKLLDAYEESGKSWNDFINEIRANVSFKE